MVSNIIILLSLISFCYGFSINNNNDTMSSRIFYESNVPSDPIQEELKLSQQETMEIFGKKIFLPEWMTNVKNKGKKFFDSSSDIFGINSVKEYKLPSSGDFLSRLKKDQKTRIWTAIYINFIIVVLIYIFIAVKLMFLSIEDGQQERQKQNKFKQNLAYESSDFNLPLATISKRNNKSFSSAIMTIDNPLTSFVEMAREAEHLDDDEELELRPTCSNANQDLYENIYEDIPVSDDIY